MILDKFVFALQSSQAIQTLKIKEPVVAALDFGEDLLLVALKAYLKVMQFQFREGLYECVGFCKPKNISYNEKDHHFCVMALDPFNERVLYGAKQNGVLLQMNLQEPRSIRQAEYVLLQPRARQNIRVLDLKCADSEHLLVLTEGCVQTFSKPLKQVVAEFGVPQSQLCLVLAPAVGLNFV